MRIRFWGARGSIPVSGAEYLQYGGDTTCVELRAQGDEVLIIDSGTGIRRLGNLLLKEARGEFSMIFTHAHWDHILGFPFFRPIYVQNTFLSMFGCPFAQESVHKMISQVMTAPYFPVNFSDVQVKVSYHETCEESFPIQSMTVVPTLTSHPNGGRGYKFLENGRSFVFLTDNELSFRHPGGLDFRHYVDFCAGADLLVHDAEYTPEEYPGRRRWGHSSFSDALELALQAGVKSLGLFHHNQERTDGEVDGIVGRCRRILQEKGAHLECFAVRQDMEISL